MDEKNTYLSFAEDDYRFFADTYRLGLRGSAMAATGQNICERYLKHIIYVYAIPDSDGEKYEKEGILKTHSLVKLIHYIKNDMKLAIPKEAEDAMYRIDGFYFTARHPGDNSFHPTEQDVEMSMDAVRQTRKFIYSVIDFIESEIIQQQIKPFSKEVEGDSPDKEDADGEER